MNYVIQNGAFSWHLKLPFITKTKKMLKYLSNEGGLDLATEVQNGAFNAMKDQFFATKKNSRNMGAKYISKGRSQHLEYRLFSRGLPEPQRTGVKTFEVVAVKDFSNLLSELPHLAWQEEGTRANVDRQPFLIKKNGRLGSITKERAKTMRKRRVGNLPRQIKVIKVPHPALPARGFLKSYNFFMKTQADKVVFNWMKATRKRFGV